MPGCCECGVTGQRGAGRLTAVEEKRISKLNGRKVPGEREERPAFTERRGRGPVSAAPGAHDVPEPSPTLGVGDVFIFFDNLKGRETVFIL